MIEVQKRQLPLILFFCESFKGPKRNAVLVIILGDKDNQEYSATIGGRQAKSDSKTEVNFKKRFDGAKDQESRNQR